ncbi:MAG: hypothetical protein B7Z51_08165 [Methyloversatilis sp. 12-65-5]|nr:MAG: hypothetical protein B7Z51_08165 [Methyloversatilis sp. 12-65-5]
MPGRFPAVRARGADAQAACIERAARVVDQHQPAPRHPRPGPHGYIMPVRLGRRQFDIDQTICAIHRKIFVEGDNFHGNGSDRSLRDRYVNASRIR